MTTKIERTGLLIAICFSLTLFNNAWAQSTLNLLGKLSYDGINTNSSADLSDIWGYATATHEFAIVGLIDGTSIVDITDPTNPIEVYWSPGASTFWRDIKTWKNYAYVTNESSNGLEIIDLSGLPASASSTTYTGGILVGTTTNVSFTSAHNLYIDENGIAYIFGANYGTGGTIMLNVEANPTNPPVVGLYNVRYCHDGFVKNNILYSAEINNGIFSIVDLADKLNPIILGTASTTNNFTHNVWLSDNGNYLFTTDEVFGAEIGAYDISDVTDIKRVDGIKSSTGNNTVVHNTHVLNDFLITSYYDDGLTVVDANCPDILVEVANYDTSTNLSQNDGCWGAYPFLPSGNIIASDINNGLFILDNNYQRASYLIGNITNETGTAINNVNVTITGFPLGATTTNFVGEYKTGIPNAGTYPVIFTAPGYDPITLNIDFEIGIKTAQNIQFGVNPVCPANLNITGNINSGIYKADDIITSTGKINSTSNGSVTFNAGFNNNEYIELMVDFEADGSFDFIAENKQCDTTD